MAARAELLLLLLFPLLGGCECSAALAAASGNSCNDIVLAPFERLRNCIMNWRHYTVVCRKSSPNFQFRSVMELELQDMDTVVINSSHVGICLSLRKHFWMNKGREIEMKFSNLTVGAAVVDTKCFRDHRLGDVIYNGTAVVLPGVDHRPFHGHVRGNGPILPRFVQCQYSFILRADVARLPTMEFLPDDPSFWNFSSPLYGLHYKWFLELRTMDWSRIQEVLIALRSTSVTYVRLKFKSKSNHYVLYPLVNMTSLYYMEMVLLTTHLKDFFKGTPNLKILILTKMGFKVIPPSVTHIKNLEKLSLKRNSIKKFTNEIAHLKNLVVLSLDWNHLDDLPPFPELTNLTIVTLSFCSLTRLRANTFSRLSNLTKLFLEGNPFIFLDPLSFAGVPKLRGIAMERCSLTKWPLEAFRGLRLDYLSLRGNALVAMEDLGAHEISLKTLDVSHNHIRGWDNPQLFSCQTTDAQIHEEDSELEDHNSTVEANSVCFNGSWILKLILANNTISEITYPMRESLDIVQKVLLGGNPLDCDACSVPEVQRWLARTRANVSRPLSCARPGWVRGTPLRLLQFDARPCGAARRWWLGAVADSLLVVSGVSALVGAAVFQLRAEIAYLAYLVRVRGGDTRVAAAAAARARCNLRYDAFVCYSAKNRKWVTRRLAPLLERRPGNYSLCLFDRDFRMGTHIVANIADAIDQSRKVIVVLSRHFIQSQWCQWELELAQHKLFSEDRACLVLLELEPLERGRLPRLLRFLLDTRPVVRWPRPETAAAVAAAAQQLRRALGPSLRPPQQRPSVEHLGDNEDRCEGHGGDFALPSLLPPARRTSDEHLGQHDGHGGAFALPSLLPSARRPSDEHLGQHDGQGGAFTAAQSPEEFELREAKGSSVAELPV